MSQNVDRVAQIYIMRMYFELEIGTKINLKSIPDRSDRGWERPLIDDVISDLRTDRAKSIGPVKMKVCSHREDP